MPAALPLAPGLSRVLPFGIECIGRTSDSPTDGQLSVEDVKQDCERAAAKPFLPRRGSLLQPLRPVILLAAVVVETRAGHRPCNNPLCRRYLDRVLDPPLIAVICEEGGQAAERPTAVDNLM